MPASFISQINVSPLVSQTGIVSGSFSVQAGDVLVAGGMSGTGSTSAPFTITDSMGLTWTKRAEVTQTPSVNYAVLWTAVVQTTGTVSYQINRPASGPNWRGFCQVWRGVSGIGAANTGQASGGEPTTTLTTSANSSIVIASSDNTAIDASTTYNTATAGAFTPGTNYPIVSLFSYAFYAGYYADVGAAGSKTVGITYPNAQNYSIVAVELESISTEILGDPDDFYIMYASPTYTTSREGGGTPTISDTGGLSVGQMNSGGNHYAMQGYLLFDVSGLTDYINPSLELYSQFDSAIARHFDVELRVHDFGTTSELADFVPGSQLASKTLVATVNTANWPADGGLIPFTIDSDALTGAINAAKAGDGWLRLVVSSAYQRTGSASPGVEYVGILSMETGEANTFPRLTYAIPSGPVLSAELYENGVFKQFLGTAEITASGVVTFDWSSSVLTAASGADVELRLTSTADIDIGAVQWQAMRTSAPPPEPPTTAVESWGVILM